ncbi:unnamed protein product, partial [Prorocentrum cordatum]
FFFDRLERARERIQNPSEGHAATRMLKARHFSRSTGHKGTRPVAPPRAVSSSGTRELKRHLPVNTGRLRRVPAAVLGLFETPPPGGSQGRERGLEGAACGC